MMHRSRLMTCLLPLMLGACGANSAGPSSAFDLPPAFNRTELALQPGDILQLDVWPDVSLGGQFVVEESGYVYLPFLQRVQAAGVPLGDLRSRLRSGYAETMQSPVVTITPLFRVALMGQVGSPGVYTITPAYTLFDLIGEAGGFRPEADQERVRIVRPGAVVQYDAFRALESGQNLDLVQLRSGDQVIVPMLDPPTDWRTVLNFVQSISIVLVLYDRFIK